MENVEIDKSWYCLTYTLEPEKEGLVEHIESIYEDREALEEAYREARKSPHVTDVRAWFNVELSMELTIAEE